MVLPIPSTEINGNDALEVSTNANPNVPVKGDGAGLTDGVVN